MCTDFAAPFWGYLVIFGALLLFPHFSLVVVSGFLVFSLAGRSFLKIDDFEAKLLHLVLNLNKVTVCPLKVESSLHFSQPGALTHA